MTQDGDNTSSAGLSKNNARIGLVALCLFAAVVLLVNLGDAVLWVDEADTACIARNILKYGLPVCWDHGFLIEAPVTKYAAGWVWNQHPWLMHYLIAASFGLLGRVDAFAARLPFALLGIATIPLTYLLARRAGARRGGALFAAALLAANVQFILFARQARYFALLSFTTVLLFLGFLELHRRRGLLLFILGAVTLFHSQYLTFFPIGAACWLWTLAVDRDLKKLKRLAVATGIIVVLTIPWMFMFDVFAKKELVRSFSLSGFVVEMKEYVAQFNRRVFPLAFGLVLLALAAGGYRRNLRYHGLAFLAVAAAVIFVVPISVVRSLRYLVGFLPVLCVSAALIFEELWRWRRGAAVAAAVLFITTNLWSQVAILPSIALRRVVGYESGYRNVYLRRDLKHYFLRSEFADLFRELRTGYHQDPLYPFLRLIDEWARPDDLIVTSHYSTQVDFYTRLPTMAYFNWEDTGFKKPEGYLKSPEGFQRIWYMRRPTFMMDKFEAWVRRGKAQGRLRVTPMTFDAPDIAVGNDPDLGTRLATREAVDQLPRVRVYLIERISGVPSSRPSASLPVEDADVFD